jgi:isocitrate lyase
MKPMQALKNRLRAVFCCPCKCGATSLTMSITTPDAASFKKSQPQIIADIQRSLDRGPKE